MSQIEFDDDEPYVVIEKSAGVGPFLVGLAIGAGVALLFAPQTGEETRRRIRRSAERFKDVAVDTFDDARLKVEEQIDVARQKIDMRKQQVTRAVSAGREAAQEARAELARRIAETKAAYRTDAAEARATRAARGETAGA